MNKYAKFLVAIAFFFGIGATANAELRELVVVKLPFESVIGGKTLPAGTYTVSRLSNDNSGPLMVTNHESGNSIFVLPAAGESASRDKSKVSFQRAGDEKFLNAIETQSHTYYFAVSRRAIMEAAAKSSNNGSAAGGSN
jgi:hypothetical protein